MLVSISIYPRRESVWLLYCNFEPIFFTEKDIEMLQGINSLVEEEVSVLDVLMCSFGT